MAAQQSLTPSVIMRARSSYSAVPGPYVVLSQDSSSVPEVRFLISSRNEMLRSMSSVEDAIVAPITVAALSLDPRRNSITVNRCNIIFGTGPPAQSQADTNFQEAPTMS